jgi:hypothetical protein
MEDKVHALVIHERSRDVQASAALDDAGRSNQVLDCLTHAARVAVRDGSSFRHDDILAEYGAAVSLTCARAGASRHASAPGMVYPHAVRRS